MRRRTVLLGVLGCAFVVLLALAWVVDGITPGPTVVTVLTICAVGGLLALMVVRAERRAARRQRRIENQLGTLTAKITRDHKRAAVWNFHLRNDLGLPGTLPSDAVIPPAEVPMPDIPANPDLEDRPVGAQASVPTASARPERPVPDQERTPAEIRSGRVTVVIDGDSESSVADTVDSVLADAGEHTPDLEILVVGTRGFDDDRVRPLGRARSSSVDTRNDGLQAASGTLCLLLGAGVQLRPGSLRALVDVFDDPLVTVAQPVVLDGAGLIRTAGCHFAAPRALPAPLLAGLPGSDAERLDGVRLAAADGAAVALRTADARAAGGFDPALGGRWSVVDLCLRMRDAVDGVMAVPGASVDQVGDVDEDREPHRRAFLQRWEGELPGPSGAACEVAGLTTAYVATDGRRVPAPVPILVRDGRDTRTRWGIKISSPPGRRGVRWGDTHFASALKTALERQGQVAVVHPWGSHDAPAAGLDDVHLVLRGKRRVLPVPGKVNVLWVISHPEAVSVDEVLGFDVVLAASRLWADEMTRLSGRTVLPLLQATDATTFGPDGPVIEIDAPLFVGGVHPGRERAVVGSALAGGVPLAVYGHGWDGVLPEGYVRGPYVHPADLPAHYRGAPRVLADHWPEMAANGFVQNRVFDAVASGAPVISDPVADLEEIFGGAVPTYTGPSELALLCGVEGEQAFPALEERVRLARRTCREHSFDARAGRLVDVVAGPGEVIRCS